jgi:hypothetical protein
MDMAKHADPVGAYVFVSEADEQKYHFRERELAITAECEKDDVVLDLDRRSNNERGHLLIHVPSPWHAAISLAAESRSWLEGRYTFGKLHQPLIFRGQADSRWPITSSFERRADLTPEFKKLWIYTFTELIERILCSPQHVMTELMFPSSAQYDPDLTAGPGEKAHHVATAQHFGIPTPYLDFTTDPAVAVWFACRGAQTASAPLASVFAAPLLFLGQHQSGLLMPHPYVGRLYRQRGLVVITDGELIRRVSVEVRFPPDPSFEVLRYARFKPFLYEHERVPGLFDRDWGEAPWPQRPRHLERDGAVDLLSEDSWWVELAGAARQLVEDKRVDDFRKSSWTDLPEFIGELALLPQFMRADHKGLLVRQAAIDLIGMLLSLSTEIRGTAPTAWPNMISYCASANPKGLRAMMPLMREVLQQCPAQWPLRLAAIPMLGALDSSLSHLP